MDDVSEVKRWTGAELKHQILERRRKPLTVKADYVECDIAQVSLSVNPLLDDLVTLTAFSAPQNKPSQCVSISMDRDEFQRLLEYFVVVSGGVHV